MYLTHGSRARQRGGLRGPRRPARCARDGRPPGSQGNRRQQRVFGRVGSWRHRREAATADLPGGRGAARRPQAGSGPGRSGAASAASRSSQHAVWIVLQNRASSSPGQGLFREPGAVARPGSERTAPARGPACPAGRHRAAGPGRGQRRPRHDGHPVRRRRHLVAGWREHGRGRPADLIPIRSRGRQAACR